MFKKILIATALIAIIGVLVLGAVNRTLANDSGSAGQGSTGRNSNEVIAGEQPQGVYAKGQGNGGNGAGDLVNLTQPASGELNAEETAALAYIREEEKLAHDVYVTLYTQWGLPIFQNISQSEQIHTDAVKTLLDRYGQDDPASNAVGVFTNPELQALYTDLVARGKQSLAEALKVGAAIEEIDILDLQKRMAQTSNADIQQVFNNLLSGSYNHLQAFVSTLRTQTGETYQPQYLSPEAYQAISSLNIGNGNRGGNGQGGNGGGRGSRP